MNCTACEFHTSSRVNCLNGCGPTPCDVMFVASAPGAAEEQHGVPMAGEAGFLMNDLLQVAGLSRQNVKLTYAIRCRPPTGKSPTLTHIKACRNWLVQEVVLSQPRIIVVMGADALQSVMQTTGIMEARGNSFVIEKIGDTSIKPTIVFCMTQPSSVFRRWEDFPIVIEDFKKLGRIVAGLKDEAALGQYYTLQTVSQVDQIMDYLEQQPQVSFDLETTTYDFWNKSLLGWTNILCVSLSAAAGSGYVIPFCGYKGRLVWDHYGQDPERDFGKVWARLCKFFSSSQPKWAQNGIFDINFLRGNGLPFNLDSFTFDTMLAHHTLQENTPHSLDFLCGLYTNMPPYWLELTRYKQEHGISTYADFPEEMLWKYAAADADATTRIGQKLNQELDNEYTDSYSEGMWNPTPMRTLFETVVMPLNRSLVDMEWRGIVLDDERIKVIQAEEETKQAEATQTFMGELSRIRGKIEQLNLASSQQMQAALFNPPTPPAVANWDGMGCNGKPYVPGFGFEVLKKTAAGKPSCDVEVLEALAEKSNHPAIQALRKIRKCQKKISTYLGGADGAQGLIKYQVKETKRVHPSFSQHTVVTGRLATAGPAIHNIPSPDKDPDYSVLRKIFTVPEGWWMIQADYSQLELRVVAAITREVTMLKAFDEGKDIHKWTAAEIFGIPYEEVQKPQRKVAKDINFGIIYGKTEWSLAEDLGMTVDEAVKFLKMYFNRFAGLRRYIDEKEKDVRETGVVTNNFGRKRRLYGYQYLSEERMKYYSGGNERFVWDMQKVRREMERQAINFGVQSCGHDILSKYGTAAIHNQYRTRRMQASLIFEHHDALYAEAPTEELFEAAYILQTCMETPVAELDGFRFPIDLKIGRAWDDVDEVMTQQVNDWIKEKRANAITAR